MLGLHPPKREYDKTLIASAILALVVSSAAAYFGQPAIHGNDQAVNVIVTVYSILAGFVVAILGIVGDPALLPHRSWRIATARRDEIRQRIVRYGVLFVLYLITLLLVFLAALLKDDSGCWRVFLERAYLFCGTFSFMFSFVLPFILIKVHNQRLDEEIKRIDDELSKRPIHEATNSDS